MTYHLRVNPVDCSAHGMCAELLPERVSLDDWGFPIIDGTAIGDDLVAHARRAAEACPVFALKLERSVLRGGGSGNLYGRPARPPRL